MVYTRMHDVYLWFCVSNAVERSNKFTVGIQPDLIDNTILLETTRQGKFLNSSEIYP